MARNKVFDEHAAMWNGLFSDRDPKVKSAVTGLVEKAAFLHSLCATLQGTIDLSGAIKVHPQHPEMQKQVPAVREYARLAEAYANIVNKLNRLLAGEPGDGKGDDLDEFE